MVLVQRSTTGAYALLDENEAQSWYKEEIQSKIKARPMKEKPNKLKDSD